MCSKLAGMEEIILIDIDAPLTIDEWKHYKEELRIELDGVLDLQKKIENEDVGSSEQQG
jgi:hypothetical protein